MDGSAVDMSMIGVDLDFGKSATGGNGSGFIFIAYDVSRMRGNDSTDSPLF